ncbi:MAG: UDP-N-acetylglucosamine 2-epimerase (non-hydrolyzing) [Patescibacteria group bacterium]
MKVLTIVGTRPELIRLSLIIKKLDKLCTQILVHTGQNYDENLSDIFIKELGYRKMDYYLGAKGSFGTQLGIIVSKLEKIIEKEKPDAFLVLGDTNSSMGALAAKRAGVKVFHMEAGNRCYDNRVPEETNRRVIDSQSDIYLPYTERSRANLISEGVAGEKIYVTGNPINEVLGHFEPHISQSTILKKLKLTKKKYFLVTLHRSENVNNEERLSNFFNALSLISNEYKLPIILSLHPHTQKKLSSSTISIDKRIVSHKPFGFFDFNQLQRNALCVLSDSGTASEECCLYQVPLVVLRDSMERPETLDVGSNFVAGCNPETIVRGVHIVTKSETSWVPPQEYLRKNVSDTVVKIVLSYWL